MFTGLSTADLSTTTIVAILGAVVAFDTLLLLLVLALTVRTRRAVSARARTASAVATPLGSAAEVEARLAGRLARTSALETGSDAVSSMGAEPRARAAAGPGVDAAGGGASGDEGAPGGTTAGPRQARAEDQVPGSLVVADLAEAARTAADDMGEGAMPGKEPFDLRAARSEVEALLADVRRKAFEESRETVESGADTGPPPLGHDVSDLLVDQPSGVGSDLMWEDVLVSEGHRFARYGRPVTVAVVELVGIERLEAEFGPPASAKVVRAVAQTLRGAARASDRVARIGPARFGILLPETDEIAAINCLERVRSACDRWLDASAVSLRLAVGWASPSPNGSLSGAVQLAAERLFQEQAPRALSARRRTRPAQPAT